MIEQYVVEWEGCGYYAKSQPTYEWCFTSDITKAATYRTLAAATDRACGHRFGTGHNFKPYRVVKVDGNFTILETPGEFQERDFTAPLREKEAPITLAQLLGRAK